MVSGSQYGNDKIIPDNNNTSNKHKPIDHMDKPIVGPGRTDPTQMATQYEITTGLERLEYLAKVSGRGSIYAMDPLTVDHYGTLHDPIPVPSIDGEERIVGCTGFPKYSHDPMWMVVKPGGNGGVGARCIDCGQCFSIKPI